jgi:hypothetical protein
MAEQKLQRQLDEHEQQYRALLGELAKIGPVKRGTLSEVRRECASPGCHCHKGGAHRHGPYWQWVSRNNGKSICRMVKGPTLELYRRHVQNGHRLKAIVEQLYEISDKILDDRIALMQAEAAGSEEGAPPAKRKKARRSASP